MNQEILWLLTIIVIIKVAPGNATFVFIPHKAPELQPNDIDSGKYDNIDHEDPHLCARRCKLGEPPRICYYKFHLEPYTVLGGACGSCPSVKADCFKPQCVTADGFERAILTVNRRLPAPSIQVCQGDTIIADVINLMPGSSTSIHWHGIRQRDTPWMDGVPMVTQCPILEGQTYRYRYLADHPGTYFWHSHDGLQKADGIVGSLVIRQPDEDNPVRDLYDFDLPSHTVIVQDWMHPMSAEGLPGLIKKLTGQNPDSYLINGRGVFVRGLYDLYGPDKSPLSEFKVKHGHRYRFRIVSGSCLACPFRITIQEHKLKVISVDDMPIEPRVVDSIVMSAGERYDVVIETTQVAASYWILVRGMGGCTAASQAAVLQYEGAHTSKPTLPHWDALLGFNTGYTMNPRNSKCTEHSLEKGVCVSQLQAKASTPKAVLRSKPDIRLTMAFGFHTYTIQELFESNTYHKYFVPVPLFNQHMAALINNVSNVVPPSPLLTQISDIPPELFCSPGGCKEEICECLNLIKVPLGAVVEIIIADTSAPSIAGITHPFHIHGHDFYILEQGVYSEPYPKGLKILQERLKGPRKIRDHLPAKDTVTVPATGYAVVRVLADNPGYWLYHCHFSYHLTAGMSAIIQVGERWQMKRPPLDLPRCHQYKNWGGPLRHVEVGGNSSLTDVPLKGGSSSVPTKGVDVIVPPREGNSNPNVKGGTNGNAPKKGANANVPTKGNSKVPLKGSNSNTPVKEGSSVPLKVSNSNVPSKKVSSNVPVNGVNSKVPVKGVNSSVTAM